MELKAILYSHKLSRFNISEDLSRIVFGGNKLYVGNLVDNKICTVSKNIGGFNCTFAFDNSFVVATGTYDMISVNDEYSVSRKSLSMNDVTQFALTKPIVYKDKIYYFLRGNSDELYSCEKDLSENELLYTSDTKGLNDWVLEDDKLHIVSQDSKNIVKYIVLNISTGDLLVREFSLCEKFSIKKVIPKKQIFILVGIDKKNNHCIQYRSTENFEVINEVISEIPLRDFFVRMMHNDEYFFQVNLKGFSIYNTDDLSLIRNVNLPGIIQIMTCDNDNFCTAVSKGEVLLFTHLNDSNAENLKNKIENFFEINNLGKLIVK